ncbi:hypothetical protein OFN95_07560 [Campylobacter sp. VBCF_02 NA5]|uniref:hypothetical protein n=1 Tax=Campylobacter sp. VBCF_02 NA5 TaxID=2983834 RepID=UPI0022E9F06D|nr:hypothetical protein [Campylobacter sp. VBCF_02 NA5]MDA3061411.1 hypothetical protein [Campylobacter sp. VBCF_02 NA5]
MVICVVTIYFSKLQTQQNVQSQNNEISVPVQNQSQNQITTQNETKTQKPSFDEPQAKISSYENTMQTAIWELPSAKLRIYDNFQFMQPNDEGYLFAAKLDNSGGRIIQTDFNGKISWEKNINFTDLRDGIETMQSYIVARNVILDKQSYRIIQRIEKDKIFDETASFGENFVASDKHNNLYFLDRNLNEIWTKSIKTDLKTNSTQYYYNSDGSLKDTKTTSKTRAVCEQILKTKDNKILVSVAGQGLLKYDLNGNLIKKQSLSDWEYVKIIQSDDGSLFALKTKKENGFFYDGIANVTKFDSDLNEIWSKNLHRENGDNFVRYLLSNYKNGFLLVVSQSNKKRLETWIKFVEFDENGNKIDENFIDAYPQNTSLYFAETMRDKSVLIGGGVLYEQYSPPILINGRLEKFSDDILTSGIFIKISADLPLSKQQIREFDEEFLRK